MKRLIQAGMVLATVATAILGGGSALANSNANGSVSVTPSTTTPGGTVHISGSVDTQSCPRSDDVTIGGPSALFPPDGFGPTVSRDANGDFAVDYTVPTSTPPGSYLITLRCGGGNVGVSAELRVESAPSGAPATGAGGAAHGSSVLWTLLGLGSLTLASAFIVLRRKLG